MGGQCQFSDIETKGGVGDFLDHSSSFPEYAEDDPVMKTLREYEEREARKRKNARKNSASKLPSRDEESSNGEEDNGGELIGPVLAPLHVRVKPIAEIDVQRNRLTVEEIKSIKKFCNYEPGNPSKVRCLIFQQDIMQEF